MMHWFSGCPAVRGDIAEKKKQQEKKKRGPTYCSWQKNWHGKPTLNASLLHHSPSIPLALLHLLPNLPSPRSSLSLSLSLMDDLYSTYDSSSRLTGWESMLVSEREWADGDGDGGGGGGGGDVQTATCFPLLSDHQVLQHGILQSGNGTSGHVKT